MSDAKPVTPKEQEIIMKLMKQFFTGTILGGLVAFGCPNVIADDNMDSRVDHDDDNITYPLYRPQELQIDVFGSASFAQQTLEHAQGSQWRHKGFWGGGAGLNIFFLKYVGVGGEFIIEDRSHERFVDGSAGNVFLRYPIGHTGLAPYVFGGGGYEFKQIAQSFADAGGGLEFRFCRHLGIFVDGRWVFANRTDDFATARAGLRVSF
jgi:hypothetical protein